MLGSRPKGKNPIAQIIDPDTKGHGRCRPDVSAQPVVILLHANSGADPVGIEKCDKVTIRDAVCAAAKPEAGTIFQAPVEIRGQHARMPVCTTNFQQTCHIVLPLDLTSYLHINPAPIRPPRNAERATLQDIPVTGRDVGINPASSSDAPAALARLATSCTARVRAARFTALSY
ncbi:MAG: hypothetical protein JWM94_1989 [Sphingomonas bacterium]|nr:hypothetical protein [Sphingomonas bacterium]